ncbi:MAG: radical SAM protein [Planctomycetes bacterium]|nr:radical SAM protein [Planctomycetota bacterium]
MPGRRRQRALSLLPARTRWRAVAPRSAARRRRAAGSRIPLRSPRMAFLDQLREVTERVRRGALPSRDELLALKRENRRHALAAEARDAETCDSLPTWINTTNSTVCNLSCGFCPQAYGKGVDWRMEEPIYRKVLEELYPAAEIVQLSAFGEPMMTPRLAEKFDDMERFGVKLEMVTNATLMKGDALLQRMASIMGLLTVSIDGATKRTYDSLRVGADFDEVLGNLRAYNRARHALPKEQRAPLHLNTILMKRTLPELVAFLRLAKELDAEHVTVMHLVRMVAEESVKDEMLDASTDWKRRTNDVLAEAAAVARQLGLSVNLPPPFALTAAGSGDVATGKSPAAPPMRCWFLWQRMYVGPFGEIVPCCLAGIHKNGNVKGSDYFTEWNNALYREMRRRVHSDDPYGACKTCYLVNRSTDGGDFDKVDTDART